MSDPLKLLAWEWGPFWSVFFENIRTTIWEAGWDLEIPVGRGDGYSGGPREAWLSGLAAAEFAGPPGKSDADRIILPKCCWGHHWPSPSSYHQMQSSCHGSEERWKPSASSEFFLSFLFLFFFFFFLVFFRAVPAACGGSPARGPFGAAAAGLHHSHSNTGSLIHWVRPGIEPASSWILVRFINL